MAPIDDNSINFGDENEEAIQIDDGGNDSYGGGNDGVRNNPFMNNDSPAQDFNQQPYADSPAP